VFAANSLLPYGLGRRLLKREIHFEGGTSGR